jgi:Flp pilus assembly protein TadG
VISRVPGHALSRKCGPGQTLVEFALVIPVILLLAFGFIDIGRLVFDYNTLTNAARQAARVAAVNQLDPASGPTECLYNRPIVDPSDPHWTFRGCAVAAGRTVGVADSDVTIGYSAPPGTTLSCSPTVNVGCIASVTLVHTFSPITPIAGSIVGPVVMTTTSQMPVERVFP